MTAPRRWRTDEVPASYRFWRQVIILLTAIVLVLLVADRADLLGDLLRAELRGWEGVKDWWQRNLLP